MCRQLNLPNTAQNVLRELCVSHGRQSWGGGGGGGGGWGGGGGGGGGGGIYLIYKLDPKTRVCMSDKDRMRIIMFYRA
jgi:hypothetical protein